MPNSNNIKDALIKNNTMIANELKTNFAKKSEVSELATDKVDKETAKKLKFKFALGHKKNANVNDITEVKNTSGETIKINQFEISEVVMSRLEDILNEAKKEINLLTSRKIDYIIITGGTSNILGFEYTVRDIFGENANIGNVKLLGIRDNIYSAAIGNIVYFISKLKLKEMDYSMISDNEMYQITSVNSKKFLVDS